MIFWNGQQFYAYLQGSFTPIGTPLLLDAAIAANGNQSVVRAVAGDFLVQGANGPTIYNSLFLCAVDDGSGTAKKIFVYNDTASQLYGSPAWGVWTGMSVGCWIPWGKQGDKKQALLGRCDCLAGELPGAKRDER